MIISIAVLSEACIVGFVARSLWRFRWSGNIHRCRIQILFEKVIKLKINKISIIGCFVSKNFLTIFVEDGRFYLDLLILG